MIDYPPLHSPAALVEYYESIRQRADIQPVPVIAKSIVLAYLMRSQERYNTYRQTAERFFAEHPQAEYFMIDGKHRAAAATLAGESVDCVILENDRDISILVEVQKKGIRITGINQTLEDSLKILEEHFYEHKRFWTVEEKTQAMIAQGDVPESILSK